MKRHRNPEFGTTDFSVFSVPIPYSPRYRVPYRPLPDGIIHQRCSKAREKEALTELMIAVPPFDVKEKEGIPWLLIKIFSIIRTVFVLLMFHCQPWEV